MSSLHLRTAETAQGPEVPLLRIYRSVVVIGLPGPEVSDEPAGKQGVFLFQVAVAQSAELEAAADFGGH